MKNTGKIIIMTVLMLSVIIAFVSCTKSGGGVPVTDANGNPVTDANGNVITVIPSTDYVTVTDENGVAVTDEHGKVVTEVVYNDVSVAVPVTDKDGKAVTDADGNAVTENIIVKPTYPAESKTTKKIPDSGLVSQVLLTDGNGETATDNKGNPVTYTVIVTNPPVSTTQPTKTTWKKTFGGALQDYIADVAPSNDGGFIALVVTNSNDGDLKGLMDGFSTPATAVVKYDSEGNIVWKQVMGGSGVITLTAVKAGDDGSVYAAGYSTVAGDGQSRRGSYDAVVYKLDKTGKKLWSRSFGSSTTDMFIDLAVLKDGSVVCVGSIGTNDGDAKEFNRTQTDAACCIVKYSSSGEKIFANVTGGERDRFVAICPANDGGFYISAVIYSNYYFDCMGKSDAAVIKLDNKGKFKWVTPISGSNIEYFPGIALASDGDGCVVAGRSNSQDGYFTGDLSAKGEYDAYIIRIDDDGLVFWGSQFRGQYDDSFSDIVCSSDGYVATGFSKSNSSDLRVAGNRGGEDMVVACFSYGGDLKWSKGFGGSLDDSANGICAVSGGYVCGGKSLSSDTDLGGIPGQRSNGEYAIGVLFKFTK